MTIMFRRSFKTLLHIQSKCKSGVSDGIRDSVLVIKSLPVQSAPLPVVNWLIPPCNLGRSDEWDFTSTVGVWSFQPAPASLSLWHEARGQGSPRGAVKVKGLSPSEGSWSRHSDLTVDTTCPVVFLPPLFLILPNGSGKTPDSSKCNSLWGADL